MPRSLMVLALLLMPTLSTAQESLPFPQVSGENLLGESFDLPHDLPGDLRVAFIAFYQRQQPEVNTWLAVADGLEDDFDGLRYFEFPTIAWPWKIMKPMIDNGMRSGIPADEARARTITVFTRVGDFVEEAGLPGREEIATLLIDGAGRIRWWTTGPHTAAKERELRRAIDAVRAACDPAGTDAAPCADGTVSSLSRAAMDSPLLVAHRGASAYAPEHTLPAYELAIAQGAHVIEPDLQITADGVLIALHDETLDRTTNVAEVFPDRFREVEVDGVPTRRWYAVDFTLEEIRRLDAGSWFAPRFAGARVPTLREVIELALEAGVGIFPETKAPEAYAAQGFEMERMLLAELTGHGLERRGAVPGTPVYVQSFSDASLRVLRRELGSDLHLTFLVGGTEAGRLDEAGMAEIAGFADGIGPSKSILLRDPHVVARAHGQGLSVVPWTFRATSPAPFDTVEEEMHHFLCEIGVDGVFTDNPDLFPGVTGSGGCSPDGPDPAED